MVVVVLVMEVRVYYILCSRPSPPLCHHTITIIVAQPLPPICQPHTAPHYSYPIQPFITPPSPPPYNIHLFPSLHHITPRFNHPFPYLYLYHPAHALLNHDIKISLVPISPPSPPYLTSIISPFPISLSTTPIHRSLPPAAHNITPSHLFCHHPPTHGGAPYRRGP